MEKGNIVDIRDFNDLKCIVSYNVLNSKKDVLYKKDSKQLIKKIDEYIKYLNIQNDKLENKMNNKILIKRVFTFIFLLIITIVIIYFIMSNTLMKSYKISLIGYISSLLLLIIFFVINKNLTYHGDYRIQNEILRNENEILRSESIKDSCIEVCEKNSALN